MGQLIEMSQKLAYIFHNLFPVPAKICREINVDYNLNLNKNILNKYVPIRLWYH